MFKRSQRRSVVRRAPPAALRRVGAAPRAADRLVGHPPNYAAACVAIGRRGELRGLNAAAAALLGCTGEPPASGLLGDWIAAEHRLRWSTELREALAASRPLVVDCVIETPDGRRLVRFETALLPTRPHCRQLLWLTDLSAQQQREDALRTSLRSHDDVIAMLGHELRNPLAPMRNVAFALKAASAGDPRVLQASQIVARQVDHMAALIDDLLDVSRASRGMLALTKTAIDVTALVASAVEQARAAIDAARHKLTVTLTRAAPTVVGDRRRLLQVLVNLLVNAAKFTPQGGEIRLTVGVEQRQVVIDVEDTGIGIAPELIEHVFDRFRQAQPEASGNHGGLGLGLALVKELVELHGGTVGVRSLGEEAGTRFTVRLPCAPAASAAAPGHPERASDDLRNGPPLSLVPQHALQTAVRVLRLMVVDDNVDAADSLALLLQSDGYRVAVHYHPRAALEQVAADAPDVMLLDIGLPDMDGYALAQAIRALPLAEQPVLIALTGYGQADDRARAFKAGFDHHLIKPADVRLLTALLSRIGLAAMNLI